MTRFIPLFSVCICRLPNENDKDFAQSKCKKSSCIHLVFVFADGKGWSRIQIEQDAFASVVYSRQLLIVELLIFQFLTENNFPKSMTVKGLQSPTCRDFLHIFNVSVQAECSLFAQNIPYCSRSFSFLLIN